MVGIDCLIAKKLLLSARNPSPDRFSIQRKFVLASIELPAMYRCLSYTAYIEVDIVLQS